MSDGETNDTPQGAETMGIIDASLTRYIASRPEPIFTVNPWASYVVCLVSFPAPVKVETPKPSDNVKS